MPEYPERTLTLPEIFSELIVPAESRCSQALPVGTPCLLPLGARAAMDTELRRVEVLSR